MTPREQVLEAALLDLYTLYVQSYIAPSDDAHKKQAFARMDRKLRELGVIPKPTL